MKNHTSWILLLEIAKLAVFLFLWLYCGIAFWTLVAWAVAVGVVITAVVAVVYFYRKERQSNGHNDMVGVPFRSTHHGKSEKCLLPDQSGSASP